MVEYKTKYTKISINKEEIIPKDNYYGYIAINFEWDDDESKFFVESYNNVILEKVRDFFIEIVNRDRGLFIRTGNTYLKHEINIKDITILVNLKKDTDSKYGPDLVQIVRKCEKEFLNKIKVSL